MPQYLKIKIGDVCIAEMKTSKCGKTNYDICWCSNTCFQLHFPKVDTGVECQPNDRDKKLLDFQNDYIHARRAIAAATLTAKRFLDSLPEIENSATSDFEMVHICLRTNHFDRGKVIITPQEDGTANLRMEIGQGPKRPPNAHPAQVKVFNQLGIGTTGVTDSLALALQVLDSEGAWMLKVLGENIQC
jgi:hypothetical protein